MNRLKFLLFDYGYVARARLRTVRYGLRAPEVRGGTEAPVLILPGVFETWHYLKALIDRLSADGHPVHVVQSLGFNRRTVPESASLVQGYLREHELRGVIIVAHSKGGLIGKRIMSVDDRHEHRIERMVSVNTPFAGSAIARYAVGKAMREFHPGNATFADLARDVRTNERITSIYSAFDQYIPHGSELPGARNIELPLVGHFRPLADARVLREVMAVVETSA